MDIKSYVEEQLVKQREDTAVILEIFKTGSQLFRETPGDLDFVAICSNYKQRRRRLKHTEDGITYDVLILDELAVKAQLDFNEHDYIEYRHTIYAYLLQVKEVIYGNYNLNWSLLDHKEEYKAYLKERYINSIGKMSDKRRFGKPFSHYYVILKMLEDNSLEITEEIKRNVSILHSNGDEVLPIISWIEEKLDI